jgi:predicted PurR-regulated permease PerM
MLSGVAGRPPAFQGSPVFLMHIDETANPSRHTGLISAVLAIAGLYLGREVLIPVALAILLAFLLEPLAKRFERLRAGRFGAALAAVLLAVIASGIMTELVARQLADLGNNLPDYEQKIHEKVRQFEFRYDGAFGRAAKSIQDLHEDLTPPGPPAATNIIAGTSAVPPEAKPIPVEVKNPRTSPLQFVQTLLGPVVDVVTKLVVVTIICIFILAGREDLRNRLLRICGTRNKKLTNKVLNETGERLSRYLLMQLVVNTGYGVPIGLGLWAIGIPNPLLWGMIAGVFRYIPYAGPWIAAAMPFLIGWAVGSGWSEPLLVLALFAVVELLTANFIEPWLYGNSTGITPLAVLLAAVFWTWIWGPAGLLLSMPLTVCVISISRYVPQLELLDQLFGEADRKSDSGGILG